MEFLMQYHLLGLVIGIATFLIIGLFHPVGPENEAEKHTWSATATLMTVISRSHGIRIP